MYKWMNYFDESHGCLKVSIGKLVDAPVKIFDRIHNLHDQITKS